MFPVSKGFQSNVCTRKIPLSHSNDPQGEAERQNSPKNELSQDNLKNTFFQNCPNDALLHTVPKRTLICDYPTDILYKSMSFLSPEELTTLSRTCNFFHHLTNNSVAWKIYLKPEFKKVVVRNDQNEGKALFKIPKNRLDKYIPMDRAGINYLENLNPYFKFYPSLILYVKKAMLSIKTVHAINKNESSFQNSLPLSTGQIKNIQCEFIKFYSPELIKLGYAPLNLTSLQRHNLQSAPVRDGIRNGIISLDRVLKLKYRESVNIQSAFVLQYYQEIMSLGINPTDLTALQRQNLDSNNFRINIQNGSITLKQVLSLTWNQTQNINSHYVQRFIFELKDIGVDPLNLTLFQRQNIESKIVRNEIKNGSLSLAQIMTLTENQSRNLHSPRIQEYRTQLKEIEENYLNLTPLQRENLESEFVTQKLNEEKISLKEVLTLTEEQSMNMHSKHVQKIWLQLENIGKNPLELNSKQRQLLCDLSIRNQILSNPKKIGRILNL